MKKEFNILNYFNMRALFMGIGLSRILNISHEYCYLSLIFGTILGIILLYLIKIETKKNIINILINMIIIIICLIIVINMISTMYLTKMPKVLIGFPFIILVMYLVNKKDIVTLRLSNILIVLNVILYLIAFFSLIPYFNFSNFYYTNIELIDIIKGSIEYALFSATPTLLLRNNKYKDISLIKTYIISSLSISIIFILTYGILGPKLTSILRYPEYLVLKQITISEAIQNIENIISFMWIFDIFMLVTTASLSIKDNLNNKNIINILLPITLFITTLINMRYEFIILTYKIAPYIIGTLLIIFYLINRKKLKI